jgi:hypothetical protein
MGVLTVNVGCCGHTVNTVNVAITAITATTVITVHVFLWLSRCISCWK